VMKVPALRKWVIVGCPKCKQLFIVRSDRRTFKCRNERCCYTIRLLWTTVRALYTSNNLGDVRVTLQNMKQNKAAGKLWRPLSR